MARGPSAQRRSWGLYFDMLRSAVKDNLDALQRVAEQGLTGAQYTFGLLYDLAERLYAFARQGYTELFIVVVIAFIAFRILVGFSRGFRGLRPGDTIIGRAYVTDGDGLRVSGYNIRMASLDAPEWDQMARHQDGYWFNHGKRVKSTLIQAIGGRGSESRSRDTTSTAACWAP